MRKWKLEELNNSINSFKTVSEIESESEPSFLSIKRNNFKISNGQQITREEFLVKGSPCKASIILPVTVDNEVILTVQPRPFLPGGVGVELPAGLIEEDENPLFSAKRELLEETGYEPKSIQEIITFSQSQGFSRGVDHGYLAEGCKRVSNQRLDDDEFIKLFLCSFYELLELIDMNYIKDANSLLIIERAKKYIKRRKYVK